MKLGTTMFEKLLDDIRMRVGTGDSFEGTLSYSCLEDGLQPGEWEVSTTYRVGNLNGQGGTRMLLGTMRVDEQVNPSGTYLKIDELTEQETHEVYAFIKARSAYRDPAQPERTCEYCHQPYHGPALYCCLACALADSGAG
jgi:hypothetical protein